MILHSFTLVHPIYTFWVISNLVVGPNYQSGQIYHAPANQIIWNHVQLSRFSLFEIHIEITKPRDQVIFKIKYYM